MKALRRSIKGEKNDGRPPQIAIAPKSALAIVPPKKVIRALYDYEAQSSQELSFSRGDFFHVIGRENDTDWYEACNPAVPDARGLVPVAFFQALGRTERDSGQSDLSSKISAKSPDHDSGYSDTPASASFDPNPMRASKMGVKQGAMVYGMVMYDFAAERPDELDAKAGEAIIVIAQSNPEWFVAKPIGRLGGPGLIPVSFIEIRDMTTGIPVPDALEAVQRAGVPKVEEWKKMTAEYKNSSISLGKFEGGAGGQQGQQQQQSLEQSMDRMSLQQQQPVRQSANAAQQYQPQPQQRMRQSEPARPTQQAQQQQQPQQPQPNPYASQSNSQLFAAIRAHIPRYCFAQDKYWFVIEAELEDGRHWELSRYYEDFYDFQIALLTEFPDEAGNTGKQKRTLPYMPGPVNYVTDAITEGRQNNLDAYIKNLLAQPPYISRCQLVRQFFAPREGDFEIDPNVSGEYRLSGGSQSSMGSAGIPSAQSSRGNLNGNEYPGLSAPPRQSPQHRSQASQSNGQNYRPEPTRQPSSLTQASTTSLATMGTVQPGVAAMKVKIYFGDDLIAIRVPTDIQFQALYDKIRDRLKIPPGEEVALTYKDEASGERPNLMSNNDLDFALRRNDKLIIYANYS